MPRAARLVIPNFPHHIVHRGHNKTRIFAVEEDFVYYLSNLRRFKEKYGCLVYAYCLMTNHVHIIINPGRNPDNLARLMKRVAGRYTRYVNASAGRSGTLWDRRYMSSPIETERYLLACSRYVEQNPVRAGLVTRPDEYPWSSFRAKIGLRDWGWVDQDPCYVSLGSTVEKRIKEYQQFVSTGVSESELAFLSGTVRRGHLTGTETFVEQVERMTGFTITQRMRGRPKKYRRRTGDGVWG